MELELDEDVTPQDVQTVTLTPPSASGTPQETE